MKSKASLSDGSALTRCSFLLIVLVLMSACASNKDLQKKLCESQVGLGYEFTSQPYTGSRKVTVVLKELGAANMDYRTWVKKEKEVLVPLLLYNYRRALFNVTLGEQSLIEPYRYFFLNALYTECDNSGCFNMVADLPEENNDSVYIMELYFDRINTQGQVKYVESVALWFDEDLRFGEGTLEINKYSLQNVASQIAAHVAVYRGAECVFRKSYQIDRPYVPHVKSRDIYMVADNSMRELGNSLSQATRELIESIVQEVNLLVSGPDNAPVRALPSQSSVPDQSDIPTDSSH